MFVGWLFLVWFLGIGLLGVFKIVENMEFGYNVMYGQFDWLNDLSFNGINYDWDIMVIGFDWKYIYNYIYYIYINIVGMDYDVGYGLVCVSDVQVWEFCFLLNLFLVVQLMVFFEWYVGI